jgi:hypothetical protein
MATKSATTGDTSAVTMGSRNFGKQQKRLGRV